MYTRGYAKHPCTRVVCSRGLAVGRVERYPCTRIRTKGAPCIQYKSNSLGIFLAKSLLSFQYRLRRWYSQLMKGKDKHGRYTPRKSGKNHITGYKKNKIPTCRRLNFFVSNAAQLDTLQEQHTLQEVSIPLQILGQQH